MKIDPLSDVIIIKRSPPKEMSDSGILLSWDADYREDIGIVRYVGHGKKYVCKKCKTEHVAKPAVKEGDKVLFSTNGHQITVINGEELVVLREPSIIGVFVE
jgi:co-chaperonin GroES (HSP10)